MVTINMWNKVIFAVLSIGFLVLVILVPAVADLSRYNLAASEYQVLFISTEVPAILIWLLAFYSYTRLKHYALSINGSPESNGFRGLARGCQWLAWGLPVSAVITLLLTLWAARHPSVLPASIIISNYVSVLFPIIAFSTMSASSQLLMERYKLPRHNWWHNYRQQILFIVIGVIYSYFILRNLHFISWGSASNQYFLPLWLLVITLIVPYLYAWFLGLLTAFDIIGLARQTPGIIYRRGLQYIAGGLVTVIGSLMAVQYLRSLLPGVQPDAFGQLFWTYTVYIICIVGFILLLLGLTKLKKIEEV